MQGPVDLFVRLVISCSINLCFWFVMTRMYFMHSSSLLSAMVCDDMTCSLFYTHYLVVKPFFLEGIIC
jgi:hypothetical protein